MKNSDDTPTVHFDLLGQPINVGDFITYAAVDGRSGTLRIGQVIALTPTKVRAKSWSNFRAQGWGDDQRSGRQKDVSLGFFDRIIVIQEEMIPEKIWIDLHGPVCGWNGKSISEN